MATEVDATPVGHQIIVVGNTGAGKSSLARALAGRLDVPFVELDALFWEPGWVEADAEVFRERVVEATAGDEWVVAGNYTHRTQDLTWPRADTIVWLDLPLHVVLPRLVKRGWHRSRSGELLWGTNTETFWKHLKVWDQTESLLAFAVRSHAKKRAEFEAATHDPRWSGARWVRLRSGAETRAFLATVPARAKQPTAVEA